MTAIRTMTILSILYIVSTIGAGRMRAEEAAADLASSDDARDSSSRYGWSYELFTSGAMRHGIQSPAVSNSRVTIGSVVGQEIYQLDVNRGTFSTFVGQPLGEADDEAATADGTLVWTSLLSGLVRSKIGNGPVMTIGQNNPVSPNGIAFNSLGQAFYSTFPGKDTFDSWGIYKVDPTGRTPQRKVMTTSLPMNGFDFSSNPNEIYGPYPFTGQIVRLNLTSQTETVIAEGFIDPESVRFNAAKTVLYVLDTGASSIFSVNIRTGAKTLVVKVPGLVYLDNFRPYGSGLLIGDTTSNSPIFYDLNTNTQRYVTPVSVFNSPNGISFANGKIYVADFTAEKVYNLRNKRLSTIARSGPQPESAGAAAVNVSFGIYNVAATTKYLALSCFYDGKVQIRDVNTNAVIVNSIPLDPTVPGTAYTPYGIDFSSDQKTLLIADFGVGLRVNTGRNFLNSRIINVGDNTVVGVAVSINRDNIVYVSTFSGTVYTVNYVTGVVRTLAAGLNDPEGLVVIDSAFGDNDIVMVANVGDKNLLRINANTGAKSIVATNLPIGLAGPATLPPVNTFTGVTADNDGNVYITSDLNDALIKIENCRY